MQGIDIALGELTLVFFTTMAPSGVAAIIILSLILIFVRLTDGQRQRINRILWIPIVVSLLGLVASATHLGNPANALYVFMGIGRSPLSNEVFAAVVFYFVVGSFWIKALTSNKQQLTLQRVWLGVIAICGVAFILSIAYAYSVPTIISWSSIYVPANLCLNALVGGPVLALFSLNVAKVDEVLIGHGLRLCLVCLVALVINTGFLVFQWIDLLQVVNSVSSVQEIVPYYPFIIVMFAMLNLAALVLAYLPLKNAKPPILFAGGLAGALSFVAIFATRFAFYAMHMTVGISF